MQSITLGRAFRAPGKPTRQSLGRVLLAALILLAPISSPGNWMAEALAQPAQQIPPPSEPVPTAPVRVDGEVLFRVRGVSALPANQRAARIARAIVAVARDRSIPADSVYAKASELGIQVVAAGEPLLTIVEADGALEGIRADQLASVIQPRIRAAILRYRTDREPGRLARRALLVLGGLVLLVVVLLLLSWITRRVDGWLERRMTRQVETVQERTAYIVRAELVFKILHGMTKTVRTLATVVLLYLYLQASLALFPWTRQIGRQLLGLVANPLRTMGTAIVEQIPEFFFLIVLIAVTRWTLRAIRLFFTAVERGRLVISGFDPEWATTTYRIVRVALIAFAVVVAYPYIPGSESGIFKGVSIFLGLLVSIGSSAMLANIIAGYSMTYRSAFRVGDRIRVNDLFGDVTEIRTTVTTLRTPKNEQVVVPNSIMLNSPIVNYSALARSGGLILHTTVGIGYETPWRQVEAMLLLAAERTQGLAASPPAFVRQESLGDFCVVYELNAYCADAQQMLPLYDRLHQNVLDVFNEYGVQIMTPAYEDDPDTPKIVPKEQWFTPPAHAARAANAAPPTGPGPHEV